jgi:hypothetical protein
MKKIFVLILVLFTVKLMAQPFNNEWIDYSKTYYKFKVPTTGLYRISRADLLAVGLSNTPAEHFQLWRNGKQISLFTSTAAGVLGTNDYIEFWGLQNDGEADRAMYLNPLFQLSDAISLQTDTAAYFLTVNTTGGNSRFVTTPNNVAGNSLPATPFFMHVLRHNFNNQIHRGTANVAGSEYLYSSSYDIGEMWSTDDIRPNAPLSITYNDLNVAMAGPAGRFRISAAGSAPNIRTYRAEINSFVAEDTTLNFFTAGIQSNDNVPLSSISSNTAIFKLSNNSPVQTDRVVFGFFELTYPRLFNFSNQSNFSFSLSANAAGNYLEIAGFNNGGIAPVLYDITNGKRYLADIATPGIIKIVLEPSATSRNLVLVSQAVSNIRAVTPLQSRNFTNYSTASNQGDYLIISNSLLYNGTGGINPVDQYRQYRASAVGGNYNAKVVDIDQLVDQFAFGIKKHPLSIKNFLHFARTNFSIAPKFALLIGKGVTYRDYRRNESSSFAERLNLVPTFGYPASDILLASASLAPVPATAIGRIGAVTPQEVTDYLNKVKQFEQAQASTIQTIDNKAWMKNIVHVAGSNDANIEVRLTSYLRNYENIIKDTLFGANVVNFNKQSTGPVTPIVNALMNQMFEKGISLLTYYGHSSATSLDYNLDDPAVYNNTGKYPFFSVNGCNAGDFYSFDTSRFLVFSTLSEKYTLAPQKGCIGFIASTHFGLENYLDYYSTGMYRAFANSSYNQPVTKAMLEAVNYLRSFTGTNDFYGRIHAEQTLLHGDPALKINAAAQPDFVVEDPQVKISPVTISVADVNFKAKTYFHNIGRATGDSVSILIRREYPNGSTETLLSRRIKSVRYIDSVELTIPIVPTRDAGQNKLIVSIDNDNRYTESSEANNTITKTFFIFEDDIKPVYPYNFSIINRTNIKLTASTANALATTKQYVMEIDTTELFNSTLKVTRTIASNGGMIEFDPGISFTDSTVYYWRVAPVPTSGAPRWATASFVYLIGTNLGYNQSHFYQHTKSTQERIYIDTADRKWKYRLRGSNINIQHSIYPTSGTQDLQFSVSVNGAAAIYSACIGRSVIFNVLDPVSLKPLYNQTVPSTIPAGTPGNFMGSAAACAAGRQYNFEFGYWDTSGRRRLRDFMDWIPNGHIVVARLVMDQPFDQSPFVSTWINDATIYGANNTFYSRLKGVGFTGIDQFTEPKTWALVYKKNDLSFAPQWKLSLGLFDRVQMSVDVNSTDTLGYVTSPVFGPATAWKQLRWRGSSSESTPGDVATVNVIGVRSNGTEDVLYTLSTAQQDFNLNAVSVSTYPYLKLQLRNQDSVNLTPYQLRYWRVFYDPVPEGALAPSLRYTNKDTLDVGEPLNFSIAFKNVSDVAFADSVKVKMVVFDKNNVATTLPITKRKKIIAGDTAVISYPIDTKNLVGNNTLQVDVNPDNDQPEQTHINNFLFKGFYVKPDTYNPLMDVTFDGVHILNNDIVSGKPHILVKVKDESKYLALDDTSLATIFVKFPDNSIRRYRFGTDTLRFTPANTTSGINEAIIDFNPSLLLDGDYELTVRAKDKSGNNAGTNEYRVQFQVINKPMISNLFNYPNPFTSSTAFVFTITGSQVPQQIKIQIMTVTGKIVREITKDELGPINVGRNITDFKWDGTDQYGQKLANGVYLYRVVTNLNGNSLEKYTPIDQFGDKINTDKFFNKGYGKMYLMR